MKYASLSLLLVSFSCAAQTADDVPDSDLQPPAVQQRKSLENYQQQIEILEARGGPFNPDLEEALIGQGLGLLDLGEAQPAVAAFERALHIARVNEGLHNIRHAPLVELIIDANLELRDWDALDRYYEFLYWIYRRNYGADAPRVIPLIEQFARRRLEAFENDRGGGALNHLIKADNLYDAAIDILEKETGGRDARLIDALYQSAVINYYLADTVSDTRLPFIAVREAMLANHRPVTETNPKLARDRIALDSYFKGELAIERIQEMTAANLAQDPVAHAKALTFAGDYYLASRHKWDAMRRYAAAWKVIHEYRVSPEEIDRLFGNPKPLARLNAPAHAGSYPGEEGSLSGAESGRRFVDAVFDVPASGWPTNIRIRETSPAGEPDLPGRGELAIAAVRYRPRFENGEPVDTPDVTLRYIFKE